jgi:hypothetical protein
MEAGDVTSLRARADEGFAGAQFNYGVLLANGDGIPMKRRGFFAPCLLTAAAGGKSRLRFPSSFLAL